MNQKNIFSILAAIFLLQSIVMYFMGGKMSAETFPGLEENAYLALGNLLHLVAMLFLFISLVTYAVRNNPNVLWAYSLGFTIVGINSLKHLLIDDVNVPIWAIIIQFGVAIVSAYLLMQNRKASNP